MRLVSGISMLIGFASDSNTVFRKGVPVALIDFDTVHPGPRIWDVAYASYRFVPLTVAPRAGAVRVAEQARRLGQFADAYELAAEDRAALVGTAIARLEHLIAHEGTSCRGKFGVRRTSGRRPPRAIPGRR